MVPAILTDKCTKNDEVIYINTSKEAKSNSKTIMFGGRLIPPNDLPEEDYRRLVKYHYRKKAKQEIQKELVGLIIKHAGLSKKDTTRLVMHDMNQWCNSPEDIQMFWGAFGLETPDYLPAILNELKSVFPSQLIFN